MQTVFISYAREDIAVATRLHAALKAAGISPWLDTEVLLPGQDWKFAIDRAIAECDYFIALLSVRSLSKKGFVQKELRSAFDVLDRQPFGAAFLLPVRIEDCEPADPRLQALHWVDLFPSWELGLEKLLKALKVQPETFSQEERPIATDANAIRASRNTEATRDEQSYSSLRFVDNELPPLDSLQVWTKDLARIAGILTATVHLKNGFSVPVLNCRIPISRFLENRFEVPLQWTACTIKTSTVKHVELMFEPDPAIVMSSALYDKDDLYEWVWDIQEEKNGGLAQVLVTNISDEDRRGRYFRDWAGFFENFAEPAEVVVVRTNRTPSGTAPNFLGYSGRIDVQLEDDLVLSAGSDKSVQCEFAVGAQMGARHGEYEKWIATYRTSIVLHCSPRIVDP